VQHARALGERGRRGPGPRGRQEGEAVAEPGGRVVEDTTPEMDRALAVLPGEAFLRDGDITSRRRGWVAHDPQPIHARRAGLGIRALTSAARGCPRTLPPLACGKASAGPSLSAGTSSAIVPPPPIVR
jgi:hypothetical protein